MDEELREEPEVVDLEDQNSTIQYDLVPDASQFQFQPSGNSAFHPPDPPQEQRQEQQLQMESNQAQNVVYPVPQYPNNWNPSYPSMEQLTQPSYPRFIDGLYASSVVYPLNALIQPQYGIVMPSQMQQSDFTSSTSLFHAWGGSNILNLDPKTSRANTSTSATTTVTSAHNQVHVSTNSAGVSNTRISSNSSRTPRRNPKQNRDGRTSAAAAQVEPDVITIASDSEEADGNGEREQEQEPDNLQRKRCHENGQNSERMACISAARKRRRQEVQARLQDICNEIRNLRQDMFLQCNRMQLYRQF